MRGIAILLLSISLAGCGYVGEPLPPALNIPERITDLGGVQQGPNIVLSFTVPAVTMEALPIAALRSIDLRGGPALSTEFDLARWPDSAKRYPAEIPESGRASVKIPAAEWTGKEVFFAVRVQHPQGRFSEWSNLVAMKIIEPIEPPAGLGAESVAEGVRLSWHAQPAGTTLRIYRREAAAKEPVLLGTAANPEYIDSSVEYGSTYQYSVQAVRKAGEHEVESLLSATVSISREDRFAPAVPTGLAAVAGNESIELAWKPAADPDLAGYAVYRSVAGGEFSRIADLIESTSYSDRAIEAGKRYRYTVTSIDRLKNESARSAPLEVAAP